MKVQGKISSCNFKLTSYFLILQPLLASTAQASDMGELGALYVVYALMLSIFLIIVVVTIFTSLIRFKKHGVLNGLIYLFVPVIIFFMMLALVSLSPELLESNLLNSALFLCFAQIPFWVASHLLIVNILKCLNKQSRGPP